MKKQLKTATHAKKKRAKPTRPPAPSLEVLRHAELVPVPHFHKVEPAFTQGSLRWLLFQRDQNGLAKSGAIVKIGRRLLIDPARFRAWARGGGSIPAPIGSKKCRGPHGDGNDDCTIQRAV